MCDGRAGVAADPAVIRLCVLGGEVVETFLAEGSDTACSIEAFHGRK